ITYTEVAGKAAPVTTTADSAGNYSIIVTLGNGANNFMVTSVDAFGQTISGKIAPVTFSLLAP
ncbi:MAG TPA: hypothetical protein VGZ22_16550, partial [Isosphaeraceae bacterium]|nr:hypothetical protein [Isosphaeraceae bacterium]